jgi:hypothetical protein
MILLSMILSNLLPALIETPLQASRGSAPPLLKNDSAIHHSDEPLRSGFLIHTDSLGSFGRNNPFWIRKNDFFKSLKKITMQKFLWLSTVWKEKL